jgi:hypothetical protein
MATPEAKVKAKVKALLAKHKVYYFMPATHGYGSSGVPDIVACMHGKFIGIETKANGGVPTPLQMKNLMSIVDNGGISLIIDETGIGMFQLMLQTWEKPSGMPTQGYIAELYDRAIKVPRKKDNAKPKSPN